MNEVICPRKTGLELLKQIQILYQNDDITASTKTEMTKLVKEGINNGNFASLNAFINRYRSMFTFTDVINNMLSMTN